MKMRFTADETNECFKVLARRKATGKWEQIGTCHYAAREDIKKGHTELIQFNIEAAQ